MGSSFNLYFTNHKFDNPLNDLELRNAIARIPNTTPTTTTTTTSSTTFAATTAITATTTTFTTTTSAPTTITSESESARTAASTGEKLPALGIILLALLHLFLR